MNAMDALEAARLAWEASQPQLFLELEDPAPAGEDGTPGANSDPPVEGASGAGTHLAAATVGGFSLAPSRSQKRGASEERAAPVNQQPPPARLPGRARVEAWR